MLKSIARPSPDLHAFIQSLNLPLNQAQERHITQVADAMVTIDGSKTLSGLYRAITGEAGLGAGDIIISVGNTELSQSFTLENALDRYRPGEVVKLYVLTTDGEYVNVRVRLVGG